MPRFRTLDQDECKALLARNHAGRIVWGRGKQISELPVDYVYVSGWICGRIPQGRRQSITGGFDRSPVVFEVNEVDDLFDWRSVVVHGEFRMLPADGPETELEIRGTALSLIRQLGADAFQADYLDPDDGGTFGIAVEETIGREASTNGRGRARYRAERNPSP